MTIEFLETEAGGIDPLQVRGSKRGLSLGLSSSLSLGLSTSTSSEIEGEVKRFALAGSAIPIV